MGPILVASYLGNQLQVMGMKSLLPYTLLHHVPHFLNYMPHSVLDKWPYGLQTSDNTISTMAQLTVLFCK